MFICEKSTRAKGKEYTQRQLMESVRTPAGPRQRLVLNLGLISLDKSAWKDLANAIESLLYNRPELFSPDQEVEKLAKYYAGLIQARKLRQAPHADKISNETKPEYQSIDLNSVATSNAQSIGVEHVVISQLSQYGFDKILEENGDAFFIRTSTTPTPEQQEIYAGLQIKQKPLNRVNLSIPCKTKISKNDLHL